MAASGGDARYFSTTKKGEIRELADDLNGTNREKLKEAVKKVIAAMTVGKDVSMLFSDVIKSMGTENIELKKLVYLYIINYARSQPEKAILVVNMFQRDATNHPNPLVRALAIRTMGCIRVDRITEHLCDPLNRTLDDEDPYVKKTAAICVAKMYDINHELVEDRGFIEKLRGLLNDSNPMVVANAVAALHEISEASGEDHFRIDGPTLSKLLTALHECTEWGVVFILDALSRFNATNAQAHDIIERVAPQLSNANSAVVMSAIKVVIRFLKQCDRAEVDRFCKKLAPPLVTLLSSQPEIQYVALRNIDLIVQKYPQILQNEIRVFFVKFNDAVYVKLEKLEILVKLCSRKNVDQVLLEFKEYAQEIDVEFVRKSVRAIGRVAIKLDEAAEKCVRVLGDLVRTRVDYVVQEAVIVMKDIFRRYPRRFERIIVDLCDNFESLDEPEAKAAMIWILGEYAQRIEDAGERIEFFLETFDDESPMVQLQLLTATVKVFLRRPDENKELVQRVLNLSTESSDNPDLRDRGYIYWRLLSTDPAAAKAVVLAERPVISAETFQLQSEFLEQMLDHLSKLSSVFHRMPQEFARNVHDVTFENYAEAQSEESPSESDSGEGTESESESEDERPRRRKKDSKKDRGRKRDSPKRRDRRSRRDDDDIEEKTQVSPVLAPPGQQSRPPAARQTAPSNDNLLDIMNLGFETSNVAPAVASTSSPASDDFDFLSFDPAVPVQAAAPPEHKVLDAAKGKGVELTARYARENGAPTMFMTFQNGSGSMVSRAALKFNKNYLGIQPSATSVNLSGTAPSGGSCTGRVAMQLSQPNNVQSPVNARVQMALKTDLGVCYFDDLIPAYVFFTEDGRLEPEGFLNLWRQLPSSNEHSIQLSSVSVSSVDSLTQKMESERAFKVADRDVPGRGKIVYFSAKLKNVDMLVEVSLANNGACRVVVKSQDAYLSQCCGLAVKSLLE